MNYASIGSGGPAVAAGTVLPFTGLSVGWTIVAVATLLFAGLAVVRLVPRRER